MAIIKDSGERCQFYDSDGNPTAVRDIQEGKGRCDLMPLEVIHDALIYCGINDRVMFALAAYKKDGNTNWLFKALVLFAEKAYNNSLPTMFLEVAKHFEDGAKKYGENNWQKGIPTSCYMSSAIRHYLKYLRGDNDEPHDRAFVWNIMCCIWEVDFRENKNPQN